MTMPFDRSATILINGKPYELIRDQQGKLQFEWAHADEAPWEGGVPALSSYYTDSFHMGGLKTRVPDEYRVTSRQQISFSEYGENTDGRFPNRLVPSAEIRLIGPPLFPPAYAGFVSAVKDIFHSGPVITSLYPDDTLWVIDSTGFVWFTSSVAGGNLAFKLAANFSSLGSGGCIMGVAWQNTILVIAPDHSIYKLGTSTLSPRALTANGAVNQWTTLVGATRWQALNASDADVSYIESATAGHVDTFTHAATAIPDTDGVITVRVQVVARRTSLTGANPAIRAVLRSAGVNYYSSPQYVATTGYVLYTFYFENSPVLGNEWNEGKFDAYEVGVELQTAPGAGTVRVTYLDISPYVFTWTTVDAQADWLAVGPRRLFKIEYQSSDFAVHLKNLVPGLSETTEANWGDDVIIPGTRDDQCIPPLVAYQKTAIVATDYGVHGVDDDGTGIRIIERINHAPHTLAVQDPWLYVAHQHGVTRWIPGYAEDCGPDREIYNESPVKGSVRAIAFFGRWVFALIPTDTGTNHILVGRERKPGEETLGPIIWDTFLRVFHYYLDTTYFPMHALRGLNTYILAWPGSSANLTERYIGYAVFPDSGGVPDIDVAGYTFATLASRYTVNYRFNDWRDKSFYKFLIKGRGLSANIKYTISYRINQGAWQSTDINGNTMEITSDTLTQFTLPSTAVGLEIQYRFIYSSDNLTVKGAIVYFEPFAIPTSRKVPLLGLVLRLQQDIRHSDDSIDARLAFDQMADLAALIENHAPVTAIGPWGSYSVLPRRLELASSTLEGQEDPELMVRFLMQIRETS